jgi:hypothetical protein
VVEEFGDRCVTKGSEAEKAGVVAERLCEFCFGERLLAFAADAGNFHDGMIASLLCGEPENWLQQAYLGIADGELRCVNGDGNASGTGGKIVAGERALATLIEFALGIERERVGGDDKTSAELFANVGQNLPSCASK